MLRKNPIWLTTEQLKQLSDRRLLTYFKKVRKHMYSASVCSCGCNEPVTDIYSEESDEVKVHRKYKSQYNRVKKALTKRGHVDFNKI